MLKIEKWAQDINPVIAYLAINYAWIAREKCEALQHIKERRIYSHQFPLPDFPSWFSMYKSRKPVLAYKRLISNNSDNSNDLVNLVSGFRHVDKYLKKNPDADIVIKISPQELKEQYEYWQKLCADTIKEIKEEISKTSLTPEMHEKFSKALVKDELPLGFYFLVYAPCLLYFGESPNSLYRKALGCDLTAIVKLLKIDPIILHDPAIGLQIQSIRLYGKINEYEDILAAIPKQPKINYKQLADERKSIKSDHGAQIYVFAKAAKNPLQVPQIRELYDALAFDYHGTLIDTDIKKPEGFDKTIRTKAATWQKQNQPLEKQK